MQNTHEQLNFHTLYLGSKTDGRSKLRHSSPSQLSPGSKHYQVLSDMTRKMKGRIFASDLQNDESVFIFFFLKSRLFQLPILFSCEAQGRSDNPTKKKKVHPSFRSENSQIKRIFLKAKQVGFSPLYLQVKQTCTLYFH